MSAANLSKFFFVLFSLCHLTTFALVKKDIDKLLSVQRLSLTSVVGPESLAFDRFGGGPYTGVSDGRILKWQGPALGWVEFATNSKHRDGGCDGSNDDGLESKCGRPLGIQFNNATGDLYIADAYFGLLVVGPGGGTATLLANSADGERFNYTNGLDVDQENGMVYFTDSSTQFTRRDYVWAVIAGDRTGRLIKYDPTSKNVTVLVRELALPNGVVTSHQNEYLLISETATCRILRYWLKGPKAGKLELFAELPGYPDNIKKSSTGEFWVALNQEKVDLNGTSISSPKKGNASEPSGSGSAQEHAVAMRLSKAGNVLEVLDGGDMTSISEVVERNGTLWMGSVTMPYVGVYKP